MSSAPQCSVELGIFVGRFEILNPSGGTDPGVLAHVNKSSGYGKEAGELTTNIYMYYMYRISFLDRGKSESAFSSIESDDNGRPRFDALHRV
jgi:hypothetical protein